MMKGEMKNIIRIIIAIASTMFLLVGATHAAGKLDTLSGSKNNTLAGIVMDGPGLPCQIINAPAGTIMDGPGLPCQINED
jgi:hypothetical protein